MLLALPSAQYWCKPGFKIKHTGENIKQIIFILIYYLLLLSCIYIHLFFVGYQPLYQNSYIVDLI